MLIFLFLRLHRPQRLHNIELGAGGIRELTLEANKIEQMLKYRKASFPKSVSTTFVAHCSFYWSTSLLFTWMGFLSAFKFKFKFADRHPGGERCCESGLSCTCKNALQWHRPGFKTKPPGPKSRVELFKRIKS